VPFLLADPPDIARELAALRAEVAALRESWQSAPLDDARAGQVRTLVRDVLADASTRASFASAGPDHPTAGYDHGGLIGSPDGAWLVRANILVQTRFVAASAYGSSNPAVVEQTRWGFETRRLNLGLAGTLGRPDLTWLALLSQQSQTDRFITTADTLKPLYAWIRKDLGDGWSTTVGLQNVPWDLQSDFFGSSRLSTGDYSIFNYRFGAGKQTGVTLQHLGADLRVTTGVFSQISDRLNGWNDPAALSFAVSTRAELKFGADWSQLDWESSTPGDVPGFVAGLAVCWSGARGTNPQPPGAQLATPAAAGFTTDLRAALGGATLIGQFSLMRDPTGLPELGWSCGANAQASTFLTPALEAFAEGCWMDQVPVPWIAQAGINWFIAGRAAKLTAKVIVPFGGGDVNGIRDIAGGLGIAAQDNNASFVTQLQVSY
jgi:hypothetical protein